MKRKTMFIIFGLITTAVIIFMLFDLFDAYNAYYKAKTDYEALPNNAPQLTVDLAQYMFDLAKSAFFRQLLSIIIPIMFMVNCFVLSCDRTHQKGQEVLNLQIKENSESTNQKNTYNISPFATASEKIKANEILLNTTKEYCQCVTCVYQGDEPTKCYIYDIKQYDVFNNSIRCEDYKKI